LVLALSLRLRFRARPSQGDPLETCRDEVLMDRFKDGEDAAFDVLFGRHLGPIRGMLLRLTRDPATANDLTQATFLSVVHARDRFVSGSRFRMWLYVIAMNAWRDHHRRSKREHLSRDGELPEIGYEPVPRDTGLERAVHEALAKLPHEQREAVVLHHFEEFSFKEIAEMLGISESAAKVRAHRGVGRLRTLLGEGP